MGRTHRAPGWGVIAIALTLLAAGCGGSSNADRPSSTTRPRATSSSSTTTTSTTSTTTTTTTTQPTTTVPPLPASITLAFGGDLLPHGPVDVAAAALGRSSGQAYDFAPMLAPLQPVLASVDLPICHLEVPVAPTPALISSYPVFGAPVELVAGIKAAGYRGCSTVSNHALDKGQDGIRATLDAFDLLGLGHAGSARSAEEGARTTTYDVRGVKVAHLAYAYGFNGYRIPASAPWSVDQIDTARILADAQRARREGAAFVVVSLHWGTEGRAEPDAFQEQVAAALAPSPDIDLIVGHHAHVVQPIRRIAGKLVVFGLGNQLSNQKQDVQRDGLLVKVTATRTAYGTYAPSAVEAVPTYMDSASWRVWPITATLAGGGVSPALAATLRGSYARTVRTITLDGPVEGLAVAPLP